MVSCYLENIYDNNTIAANKGSSGNANLKILSEKKLQRIIESITSTNFSLSGKIVALIAAYAQHCKLTHIVFR